MGLLDKIIGDGIGAAVEKVGGVVDKFVTTDAEREQMKLELTKEINRAAEEAARLASEKEAAMLRDVADARSMNARIQESGTTSWLARNTGYLIDIFVVLFWGAMTGYVLARLLKIIDNGNGSVDMTAVMGIYTAVSAQMVTIVSYHRGSSRGSEAKDVTIRQIASRQ